MKTNPGHFFEDFWLGQSLAHAPPRTLTVGDAALYQALYGSRFGLQTSEEFAQLHGYPRSPLDDLLVFHTVFGKSVPDISLNAVANLGYAEGRFFKPVYPGASLAATSEVIGLKENSNRQTGVVYVRTIGSNAAGETILSYVRWVMVKKRNPEAAVSEAVIPKLSEAVAAEALVAHPLERLVFSSTPLWDAYEIGEKIDHVDGVTVEEAEHMMATRLYQNTARVHFNQFAGAQGRFGRRLIYGGHVISLARALSFNGLANAFSLLAINSGRHIAPLFAGDTVFAWSEVLDKAELAGGAGALRLRLTATKNLPCAEFPAADNPNTILEFDYWAAMPRRV
ncbi:MAG TPA: MaoC family dehydratase [Rhizomicrobium sp.]|jgi:2-methylfumaryl-CoA hydratase